MAEILSNAASPPAGTIPAVAPCGHHIPALGPHVACLSGLFFLIQQSSTQMMGFWEARRADSLSREYPPRKPAELTPW